MKVIFEPGDFDPIYYPANLVEERVTRALADGYTLTVMKVPGAQKYGLPPVEVTFRDVPGQQASRIVGPIEIEFRAAGPPPDEPSQIERTD